MFFGRQRIRPMAVRLVPPGVQGEEGGLGGTESVSGDVIDIEVLQSILTMATRRN